MAYARTVFKYSGCAKFGYGDSCRYAHAVQDRYKLNAFDRKRLKEVADILVEIAKAEINLGKFVSVEKTIENYKRGMYK